MTLRTRREMLASLAALAAVPGPAAFAQCRATRLSVMLGDYPHTRALKSGAPAASCVTLLFADVAVPNTAFKRVVRDLEFDVAELAVSTFLIAKAHGIPLTLVPAVMFSRFQHQYIVYNAERGHLAPRDLANHRIGVRSYTTTTATWIRGILANDYHVDLDRLHWTVLEEGHVSQYRDPANVRRAPPGANLTTMLLNGEIDAAIVDPVPTDPRVKRLIPDADAAAREWQRRNRALQVNHMVVVKESLTRDNPEAVRETYRLLAAGKAAARAASGQDDASTPFGLAANRRNLEVAIDYAHQQRLIPRRFAVDELFNRVTASL